MLTYISTHFPPKINASGLIYLFPCFVEFFKQFTILSLLFHNAFLHDHNFLLELRAVAGGVVEIKRDWKASGLPPKMYTNTASQIIEKDVVDEKEDSAPLWPISMKCHI